MSKITADSFIATVRKSELVELAKLKTCLEDLRSTGVDFDSSRAIADGLIGHGVLTEWQVQNLLKGKYRGYTLGKYRLLSLLGKGGMSSVYLAEHTLMRRRCAIKVLPSKRVGESSYLGRFHREAQAVASLDHPNIVRAYDVDHATDKGKEIHFLVMEYVEGRDLQQMVDEDGPLDFVDAVEFARQSAEGLAHAHDSGLIHRDVKPANLLVDLQGVVKILDMGLARFFGDDDEKSLTVANDEKVLGTADYLAPEQAVDSHTADHRADVYGLGCSVYFTLCGHPPFNEGTLTQRLLAHQTREPSPIEEERPDVPPSLAAILKRMMAKKRDERFQDMHELSAALRDWLAENAGEEWLAKHAFVAPGSRVGDSNVLDGGDKADGSPPSASDTSSPRDEDTVGGPVAPAKDAPPPEAAPAPEEEELSSFLANLGGDRDAGDAAPSFDVTPDKPAVAPVAKKTRPDSASRVGVASKSKSSVSVGSSGNSGAAAVEVVEEAAPIAEVVPDDAPDGDVFVAEAVEPEGQEGDGFAALAEPAVVADEPPSRTRPRTSGRSTGGSGLLASQNVRIGIAAFGGLLTVVVAVLAFQAFTGDGSGGKKARPAVDAKLRELEVGPEGHFESLAEAVQHIENVPRSNTGQAWTIQVAGGSIHSGPLVIDGGSFAANVEFVSAGDEPAVIRGTKDGPAVEIFGGDGLTFDGFRFDGGGGESAAWVTGQVGGVTFERCEFRNYTTAGLLGSGCYVLAGPPMTVRDCTFDGGEGAAGVRLEKELSTPANLEFLDNRFVGKQRAGVVLAGGSQNVRIVGNVFDGPAIGVEIESGGLVFLDLIVGNNTFIGTGDGVLFAELPESSSRGVVARNLFVSEDGEEVSVASGNDARKFARSVATRHNWSLRKKPAKPAGKAVPVVDDKAWADASKVLASTERGAKGYLRPKPGGPLANVPGPKDGLRAHVGAIAP